jgi:exodeoxyribonuclease VII small subunit
MARKKSELSFEDKLSRLEEVAELLEQDNLGIEESISLFEEGVKLSKECLIALQKAELRITELKGQISDFKGSS